MILEVVVLDVKESLGEEFEIAFTQASPLISSILGEYSSRSIG